MMSRPRAKMAEDEVVRPRRSARQPLYFQDYEVSYPQRHLTFADEPVTAVTNADVLSYIREMREESKQLRQDVQRISAIIASTPVLAPLQVSSPLQCSLGGEDEVSSTPVATKKLDSAQDKQNPDLHRRWHAMPGQYRGPTPTIPDFVHDDPREFSRLKLALDNILPYDASESFKFQILLDHLKLEDALLVADSYSHSRLPFSDTMRALTDMYGQPHQLALQRITSLMDGPNIKGGDVKAFKALALRVRALVGMLNQLGSPGWTELKCGSHVSRLLAKLPYDLRANFKRFINPLQTPIPTLLDLADWLEYEVRVQVEGTRYYTCPEHEKFSPRKDKKIGFMTRKVTTVLHGREQKGVSAENSRTGVVSSDKMQEKPKKYCPFCDSIQHYMNQCANVKLLTKEQPQECFFVSCGTLDAELFNQVERLWKLDTLPYRSFVQGAKTGHDL
ncbi:hypothetical protein ROHU_020207 [Labeo rohita]|uniref:Uncharacterized protein n=1 Tax=Labeo rohita TaxID=84645 RepID=A0A498MZH5_LABRO|nr:hypothetical protein ROHU_020207 [Labeo rohita]